MPSRISEVSIRSDRGWKIVNTASEATLLAAAEVFVVDGGHQGILSERIKEVAKLTGTRYGADSLSLDQVVINLRTKEESQNQSWILAPIAQFNQMVAIDRDEIEEFRSIQRLIRGYWHNDNEKKPLSIGVYGPPGSGKSFGIQQIVKTIEKSPMFLEFNLAQFSKPDDLIDALLKVSSETSKGAKPIAFFDEFDCTFGDEKLGWLRYFLSPMQDGKIFLKNTEHNIGRAIFVFAGGTAATYREFARETPNGRTTEVHNQFVLAKGPDFVSRLSGHINILGINRRDEKDQSYVLRRARIMRTHLVGRNLVGKTGRTVVDPVFLRKLLQVGKYKHGARSITKTIDMCIGDGGVLYLPPAEQLSMHVDESDVGELLKP